MKIGILLLKMRKERRLSQEAVAEQLGVCQSSYCAWESDRAMPSARHYGPIATLFNIDVRDLLTGVSTSVPGINLPVPALDIEPTLQEDLIKIQREAIALQKQRIEHLSAENNQLRTRLAEVEQLLTGS